MVSFVTARSQEMKGCSCFSTSPSPSCQGKRRSVGLALGSTTTEVSAPDTALSSLQGLHLPSLTSYSQYSTRHLILATLPLNSPQPGSSCGTSKPSHKIKKCQENVSNFETKTETGLNHSFKYHKRGMSEAIKFSLSTCLGTFQ